MAKIKMKHSVTVADTFADFLTGKKAAGVSEKTLATYGQHFSAISKHLSPTIPIDGLNKADLEAMIANMRDAGLAANSIKSYTRTLKSFLSWCNEAGITRLNIPLYKAEETIKETYSDEELKKLLKKPDTKKCDFPEYRNWAIINLLLNNGCRAATIRNIQIKDVDMDNKVIYLRHTKNKRAQVIPLCEALCGVLREYMRGGGGDCQRRYENVRKRRRNFVVFRRGVTEEVNTADVFSYRLAISWKNRFAPWISIGR